MNSLKKKLESSLNQRLKLREEEMGKMTKRYHNVIKEIGNQQTNEKIKFERDFKSVTKNMAPSVNGSFMSGSMMNRSMSMMSSHRSFIKSAKSSRPSSPKKKSPRKNGVSPKKNSVPASKASLGGNVQATEQSKQ